MLLDDFLAQAVELPIARPRCMRLRCNDLAAAEPGTDEVSKTVMGVFSSIEGSNPSPSASSQKWLCDGLLASLLAGASANRLARSDRSEGHSRGSCFPKTSPRGGIEARLRGRWNDPWVTPIAGSHRDS